MMKRYEFIIILTLAILLFGCSTTDELSKSELRSLVWELETKIENLESENSDLSEKVNSLEWQLEDTEHELELAQEYIDELEKILEENDISNGSSGEGKIEK